MPDMEEEMRALLLRLDEIGSTFLNSVFSIKTRRLFARGFQLRYPPYRTLYNFLYAGGLSISGSETAALRLLRFAAERKLGLGVYYCSLENKKL